MTPQRERGPEERGMGAEPACGMPQRLLDAERTLYTELWSKLSAVRIALRQVPWSQVPSALTPQEWQAKRRPFALAVRALAEVAERQRAGYAASIADDLCALLALVAHT